MVPDDFTGYFAAAATAAGALIGLLFVAASLRPETLLGRDAPPAAKAISGSAFTALFNSFFVSLIALIPSTSLGYPAAIMALVSLYSTWQLPHPVQVCRKAASFAEMSARNMGCRSIDGEYLPAGTSRPSASAMARTWCGPAPQQMPT